MLTYKIQHFQPRYLHEGGGDLLEYRGVNIFVFRAMVREGSGQSKHYGKSDRGDIGQRY